MLVKLVDAGLPPEDQAKKFKDLEFWDASTATWVTAQDHPGFKFEHGNNDWKNGLEVKFRACGTMTPAKGSASPSSTTSPRTAPTKISPACRRSASRR